MFSCCPDSEPPTNPRMFPLGFLSSLTKDANNGIDKLDICHSLLLTNIDPSTKLDILQKICGRSIIDKYVKWRDGVCKKHNPWMNPNVCAMEYAKEVLQNHEHNGQLSFPLLTEISLDKLMESSSLTLIKGRQREDVRYICCVIRSNIHYNVKDDCLSLLPYPFNNAYDNWKKSKNYVFFQQLADLFADAIQRITTEGRNTAMANQDPIDGTRNDIKHGYYTSHRYMHLLRAGPHYIDDSYNAPTNRTFTSQPLQREKQARRTYDYGETTAQRQFKRQNTETATVHKSRTPSFSYKILLLGESGVGKTTFINSLLNYLNAETFEVGRKSLTIAVDAQFLVTDNFVNPTIITMSAKMNYSEKGARRETPNAGQSSTQIPQVYKLPVTLFSGNGELNVLDTPGINDTDGMEKDYKNSRAIMNKLEEMGNVNAICILMKPNEARLTSDVRYFLENVLQLHKNTAKNIFFCFTNAKDGPGDSLACLKVYLKRIREEMQVNIDANQDNVFCFDNSCFRYLCTIQNRTDFRTEHLDNYNSILWNQNVKMSKKFIAKLSCLKPVSVLPTITLSKLEPAITAITEEMRYLTYTPNYHCKDIEELPTLCVAITKFLKQKSLILLRDPFVMRVEQLIEQMIKQQYHARAKWLEYWLRFYDITYKKHENHTVEVQDLCLMIQHLERNYRNLYWEITGDIRLSSLANL